MFGCLFRIIHDRNGLGCCIRDDHAPGWDKIFRLCFSLTNPGVGVGRPCACCEYRDGEKWAHNSAVLTSVL